MKLTVDNLNKQAYDALKQSLLEKKYPAGMRLVDSKLAEDFAISRTPIRDALMKLSEEGLVYSNGRGFRVYSPTADDIREIFELRLMFDLYAARKVIEEILPKDADAEKRIDCAYLSEANADDQEADDDFIKSDEDFHACIVALLGNERLSDSYCDIRNQMRAFRSITAHSADRRRKAHRYHERIYQALKHRDVQAVEEAIRLHTSLSMEDALHDIEETQR